MVNSQRNTKCQENPDGCWTCQCGKHHNCKEGADLCCTSKIFRGDSMIKCKFCGHSKEQHIIGVIDLHHYAKWDECTAKINKDGATYQCICQNYVGITHDFEGNCHKWCRKDEKSEGDKK